MPVTVPLPAPILRSMVRRSLPPEVELTDLELADGALAISGRARKLGVSIPFKIELVPSDVPVEDGAHAIEFQIRRVHPVGANFFLKLAVKSIGEGSGISADKRVLRLDLDVILDQIPVWSRLPRAARRLARVQTCSIPPQGGVLHVVFSLGQAPYITPS